MSKGFVLNIPKEMLDRINTADEKITQLANTSEQASQRIISAFQQIQTQGIGAFVNSLQQANTALASLDGKTGAVRGISSITEEANKGARAVTDMQKVYEQVFKANDNRAGHSAIAQLNKQIEDAQNCLATLQGVIDRGIVNTPGINAEHAALTDRIQKLQQARDIELQMAQEKMFAAQQQDAATNRQIQQRRLAQEVERAGAASINQATKASIDEYVNGENRKRQAAIQRAAETEKASIDASKTVLAQMLRAEDIRAKAEERRYQQTLKRMHDEARETQKAAEQKRKAAAIAERNRIKNPAELVQMQHAVRSLQQLNVLAAELKRTLSTLDPKSKEFERLNIIYGQTRQKVAEIKSSMDGVNRSQKNLLNTADQLRRAFALAFSVSAIKGYVNQVAKVRGEFELQHRSLQSLLQDKGKANEIWEQTIALAVRSPFQVKELVTYTKQLAAYQVESDKIYDTTKRLADISAGLGVEMDRLILAFGQVKAANYLRGTELRQFSEAGVNLLAELAKYYSEITEANVTVAEVFNMVSKRMVYFEDVEAVIERLTDKGGMFYDMQAKQAETLKGQISNLRDAIDLMLNDIGKENEGVLKGLISTVRSLLDNWRAVASVVKLVFGGIALVGIFRFVQGLRLTGFALQEAAINGYGLTMSAARLKLAIHDVVLALTRKGFALGALRQQMAQTTATTTTLTGATRGLNAAMSSTPWGLVLTIVAALGVAIWDYSNAIAAANAKYDEMIATQLENIVELEEYQIKIDKNNELIASSASSEEELANARRENAKILADLQSKYPEMYAGLRAQIDGTVELSGKTQELNNRLERTLAFKSQSKGNWIFDDLQTNVTELQEANATLENELAQYKGEFLTVRAEISQLFKEGVIDESTKDAANDIIRQLVNAEDLENIRALRDEYDKLRNEVNKSLPSSPSTGTGIYQALGSTWVSWLSVPGLIAKSMDQDIVGAEFAQLDASVKLLMSLNETIPTIAEELDKVAGESEETQRRVLGEILDDIGIVDEKIREFAWTHITKQIGIDLVYTNKKGEEYNEDDLTEDWQRKLWNAINEIQAADPSISIPVTLEDLATGQISAIISKIKQVYPNILEQNKEKKEIGKIQGQIALSAEQVAAANAATKPLETLAKLIGYTGGSSGSSGKNKALELLRNQISLIKEMNKEYEKLGKIMDKDTAKQKVLDAYKETAKSLKLDISLNEFDDTGTIKSLQELMPKVKKSLQAELQKVIDNYQVELEIETNKEQLDKLSKDTEQLFEHFDISKTIDDLGLSKEFAKKYFDIDYINLATLKEQINESKSLFYELGDEGKKAYEKYVEKANDLENKAQMERLKKYLQYANQSIGERAKIKIEELESLAEIEKTFKRDEQAAEKEAAKKAIEQSAYQKTKKLEWEEFQKTDTFINLFKDLDSASNALLNHTIKKLNEFKDHWTDIPVQDMKNIIDKINELENKLVESSPMAAIRNLRGEGYKTGRQGNQNLANLQNESVVQETLLLQKEREIAIYETILGLQQKGQNEEAISYANQMKIANAAELTKDAVSDRIKDLNIESGKIKQNLANTNSQIVKQKQLVAAYQKQADALGQAQKMADDLIDAFVELAEAAGVDSDGVGMIFVDMGKSMMDTVLNTIMLQIQLNAATVAAQGLGVAMNMAMGIVGWIVMAVQLIATALAAIFKAKDKSLQKQIEKMTEDAEKMEEKFSELAESIDEIYSTEKLQEVNKELRETNELLIENYKNTKALQEERKRTDDVNDEIAELDEKIVEAEKDLADALANSFSHATDGIIDSAIDAATEFVDAWYDAFRETGDGMKGLEETLDEMLLNMIKKQAAMTIVGVYTDRWKKSLEDLFATDDKLTEEEIKSWSGDVRGDMEYLNDLLREYYSTYDSIVGGSGSLTGLEEGIAGASEETVQIVAAYLNSIRYFVSDNNAINAQLRDAMISNDDTRNPMLAQLRIIAQQTNNIHTLLSSVVKESGHPESGAGIKVFIN